MPITFLLLQLANLALAAASGWIHFLAPHLWDDQAEVYSTLAGTFTACLTAFLVGATLLVSSEARWKSTLVNLLLAFAFAGFQGWLLYLTSREIGLWQLLRAKLGF